MPPENKASQIPSQDFSPAVQDRNFFICLMLGATVFPFAFVPLTQLMEQRFDSLVNIREVLFLLSSMHIALTPFFYADVAMQEHIHRRRLRYFVATSGCIFGTMLVFLFLGREYINYFFIFYHICLLWHHTRQNYGLLAFIGLATDTGRVSAYERQALYLASYAGIFGLMRFFTKNTMFDGAEGLFKNIGLIVYGISISLFIVSTIKNRSQWSDIRRVFFGALLTLFFLPSFLFTDRISAFSTFALAHALQYFFFMYYVSASGGGTSALRRSIKLLITFICTSVLLLIIKDHSIWGGASWALNGFFWGFVLSHFVIDADAWKLSQPFQREYMKNAFAFLFQNKG